MAPYEQGLTTVWILCSVFCVLFSLSENGKRRTGRGYSLTAALGHNKEALCPCRQTTSRGSTIGSQP
jgi:hypothetical protein